MREEVHLEVAAFCQVEVSWEALQPPQLLQRVVAQLHSQDWVVQRVEGLNPAHLQGQVEVEVVGALEGWGVSAASAQDWAGEAPPIGCRVAPAGGLPYSEEVGQQRPQRPQQRHRAVEVPPRYSLRRVVEGQRGQPTSLAPVEGVVASGDSLWEAVEGPHRHPSAPPLPQQEVNQSLVVGVVVELGEGQPRSPSILKRPQPLPPHLPSGEAYLRDSEASAAVEACRHPHSGHRRRSAAVQLPCSPRSLPSVEVQREVWEHRGPPLGPTASLGVSQGAAQRRVVEVVVVG